MIGKVKHINVFISGYEADITIDFIGLGRITCGVLLEFEHNPLGESNKIEIYVEDKPSMEINLGSVLDVELKIIYGNKFHKITKNTNDSNGYNQDKVNSPHAIFNGEIIRNLGNNSVVCYISKSLNHINVEFDEKIEEVNVGDFICFSGEFAINSINVIS
jgi:hypothetical protein